MKIRSILLALFVFGSVCAADAQCNGNMTPGHVCGNGQAASQPPYDSSLTALIDKAFGNTPGTFLLRGSSAWTAAVMSGSCTLSSTGVISCSGGSLTPAIPATASGSANAITLTPSYLPTGVTTPQAGMRFLFAAPFTSTGATTVAITGLTGTFNVMEPDGYTQMDQYDLSLSQAVTIQYLSAQGVFALVVPNAGGANFNSAMFNHGSMKLQAGTSSTIDLGSNDGGAVVGWNSTTNSYRNVRLGPSGACQQNLFNGTANVEGTLNQTLANNTLYGVYLNPQAGTVDPANPPANTCLSFWRTSVYGNILDPHGIYVLLNGSTTDLTHVYMGLVYTYGGSITNNIGPAATMGNAVYSHFMQSRWAFGYQSTAVSNTSSSPTLATQATPFVSGPTEGISESPSFIAHTNVSCSANGAVATAQMQINGTTAAGATFLATTPAQKVTLATAGDFAELVNSYDSAPPAGWYAAQINIAASTGTCTFVTDILGHLSQ